MIYDIQITKGGNLITREWSSEISDYVEEQVCKEEIPQSLYSTVCLSVGVTLRDIFVLLSKDIQTFSAVTGCPFLEELITEAFSEPVVNKDREDMSILELCQFGAVDDSELHWYFDFHGLGENGQYAIEFCPLNEIVDFPLVLNEKIAITDVDSENVFLKAKTAFTLADVLIGIIEELAFIGPPEIKAFALQELKERAQETTEGISFEELSKRIEKQIEESKVPCKWCGEDARSQHFNKPSDLCGKCFELTKEN